MPITKSGLLLISQNKLTTRAESWQKLRSSKPFVLLLDECTLQPYSEELLKASNPFDCGDTDLNDFFAHDSLLYSRNLMGKSYCFTLDADPRIIVCAFTVSNDSIKVADLPNARKKKVTRLVPHEK